MTPKVELDDLVTAAEIGRRLGVTRQRVSQLAARDDFPAPIGKLGNYVVFRWRDVERWNERTERRSGRPRG